MSVDQRTIAAYHEAAHSVVLYRLSVGYANDVSIVPRPGILGSAYDNGCGSSHESDVESHVLSLYAGGHAQRRVDPSWNADGCEQDEEEAQDSLVQYGWSDREDEFRARSAALVDKHWTEIAAVARDLLVYEALNADEVMQIADAAAGDPDANVEEYRLIWRDHLEAFRRRMLAGQER